MSMLLLALALMQPAAVQAQSSEAVHAPDGIFSLLQQYDPLVVVLEIDLKKLKKDQAEEVWYPALLQIKTDDSIAYEQQVRVASRGNMRKKTCDFPPIKIRFLESDSKDDSLADINELKMVVTCRNTASDEQLVLRENLAYELYNLITPQSFRTKSATVQFRTPGRKRADRETKAFFIESEKEMASRIGGRPLKPRIISPKAVDSLAYTRMCVFQYMIGNTDWGAYSRHNMKIIGFSADRRPTAVPYDFDYAGLVDADYAVSAADIPVKDVRERCYLGLCHSPELYQQVFAEYLAQKKQILARCNTFPGLTVASRTDARTYLLEFFAVLENPVRARKEIIEHCNFRVKKTKAED
ncbi:MAG: hypothetical protein IPM98_17630 [Lewinellaceae bacterium]|nr:hypothetical protein [Lewinellaceae bacterium]